MPDKFDRVLGLDLVLGLETGRRWHIRLAHRRQRGQWATGVHRKH